MIIYGAFLLFLLSDFNKINLGYNAIRSSIPFNELKGTSSTYRGIFQREAPKIILSEERWDYPASIFSLKISFTTPFTNLFDFLKASFAFLVTFFLAFLATSIASLSMVQCIIISEFIIKVEKVTTIEVVAATKVVIIAKLSGFLINARYPSLTSLLTSLLINLES